MQEFVQFNAMICGIVIAIHLYGQLVISKPENQYLGCSISGYEWIYQTIEGSLFVLLHMACICL